MNKNYLNKLKLLLTSSALLLSLSACKSNNTYEYSDSSEVTLNELETTTEDISNLEVSGNIEEITTSEEVTTTKEIETTEEITTEEVLDNDTIVLNEIENNKNELYEYSSNNQNDLIASKGKEYFIKFVDFIYYDSEINGVKWNDLKEDSKEILFEELCDLDSFVMTFSPNYKENIADKYNLVKDFVGKAYYSSLDTIKSYIGEERYDKIGEYKDMIVDKSSDLKDKVIDKKDEYKLELKEWYEEFREN